MERPNDLPRIPGRHSSPVYAAAADPAQQEAGDRTSTSEARCAGYGTIKTIAPGLIGVLVNIALHGAPFPAKGERVVAQHFIHYVVDYPSGTSRDVSPRRPSAVRELGEAITKTELGKSVGSGSPRYLRQLSHKREVYRAIPLIAIQISKSHVVGERGGERVLPVKASDWRVLRTRW